MTKYQRWHDQIIERARDRKLDCYSEWHHIGPRSLGGSDLPSNLVQLTYREHFLIHWLLTKLYIGRAKRSMLFALLCMGMKKDGCRVIASWQFDIAKRVIKDHFLEIQDKLARLRVVEKEELLQNFGISLSCKIKVRRRGRRFSKNVYKMDESKVIGLTIQKNKDRLTKMADLLLSTT
jgi:hypothetical protein